VRSGRQWIALAVLVAAIACAGCWGDKLPSLDRVGVIRTDDEKVSILFAGWPGDEVERVVLNLTDDDFEEIERVLWEIEAGNGTTSQTSFTIGEVPAGFREVTALEEPLEPGDHVQVVVASSEAGTIPMSFTVGDLRSDEVLVRQVRYRSRAEFGDQAAESCPGN
jgi:hypothetical protein